MEHPLMFGATLVCSQYSTILYYWLLGENGRISPCYSAAAQWWLLSLILTNIYLRQSDQYKSLEAR